MKIAPRFALLGAMLASLTCWPAAAQDVQTGSIMICDTQKQVERFVALLSFGENTETAIKAVNAEAADPSACAIADIAYARGSQIGVVRTPTNGFAIVEVLVVAAKTPNGFQRVAPASFFTLIKLKELAV
jgi:hypothetical protein